MNPDKVKFDHDMSHLKFKPELISYAYHSTKDSLYKIGSKTLGAVWISSTPVEGITYQERPDAKTTK